MPGKKRFGLNEETREVTVVRKKKGATKPEVESIRVTVRSSRPIAQMDVREMVEKVFGPRNGERVGHHHRRHIERK